MKAVQSSKRWTSNSFIRAIRCTISYQLSVISYQLWEALNQFGMMALNESRRKLKFIHSS